MKISPQNLKSINKFLKYIENSHKILITTHLSPDEDATASVISVHNYLLKLGKNPHICLEDGLPQRHHFLTNIPQVNQSDLSDFIKKNSIDLVIFLDGGEISRFTRNSDNLREILSNSFISSICLDHHFTSDHHDFDYYLNLKRTSTAESVYLIFTEVEKIPLDLEISQALLMGILGDTGRFLYHNSNYRQTFEITSKLIDQGADIETISHQVRKYSPSQLQITAWLIDNLVVAQGYNYSFLTDIQLSKIHQLNISQDDYSGAYHHFIDSYIRNIPPNLWGFVLVPDFTQKGFYKGSIRAINGVVDTTIFSQKLNGGGHKQASGFRFEAKNYQSALKTVLKIIQAHYHPEKNPNLLS